jgi:hypothetical protein
VLIALGIMGIVVGAMTQFMSNTSKQSRAILQSTDWNQVLNNAQTVLSSPASCVASFNPAGAPIALTHTIGSQTVTLTNLVLSDGTVFVTSSPTVSANRTTNGLLVSSIQTEATYFAPKTYRTTLAITAQRNNAFGQATLSNATSPFRVFLGTDASGTVISCSAAITTEPRVVRRIFDNFVTVNNGTFVAAGATDIPVEAGKKYSLAFQFVLRGGVSNPDAVLRLGLTGYTSGMATYTGTTVFHPIVWGWGTWRYANNLLAGNTRTITSFGPAFGPTASVLEQVAINNLPNAISGGSDSYLVWGNGYIVPPNDGTVNLYGALGNPGSGRSFIFGDGYLNVSEITQ